MTGRLLPTASQLRVFCPSRLGDDLHWVIHRLLLLQKWVVFGECIRALGSAFQSMVCVHPWNKKSSRFCIFQLIFLVELCPGVLLGVCSLPVLHWPPLPLLFEGRGTAKG